MVAAIVIAAAIGAGSGTGGAAPDRVTANLLRIASCETGGKPGRHGRPDWRHEAPAPRGHRYQGGLGFLDTTWDGYRRRGMPRDANRATPAQQLAVGRILVRVFGGYSSWPACSRKLGLR